MRDDDEFGDEGVFGDAFVRSCVRKVDVLHHQAVDGASSQDREFLRVVPILVIWITCGIGKTRRGEKMRRGCLFSIFVLVRVGGLKNFPMNTGRASVSKEERTTPFYA